MATEMNLSLLGDDIRFITRLPENFGVCGQLIDRSVASGSWQDVGRLSYRKVKGKEVCVSYRLWEETVELQGWNKRNTFRPISFMMASKFSPVKGDHSPGIGHAN